MANTCSCSFGIYYILMSIFSESCVSLKMEQYWHLGKVNQTRSGGGCGQREIDTSIIHNVTIVQSTIQCLALLQPIGQMYVTFNKTNGDCTLASNAITDKVYIHQKPSLDNGLAICDQAWQKLFEVEADGSVLYGTRADVSSATLRGDDMRIHLPPDLYLEVNDVIIKNDVVCASSLFVLSKNNWNTFKTNMYWEFVKVCNHGKVHWGNVNLGEAVNPTSTSPTGTHSVWFSRRLKQTHSQTNPVYCNHANRSRTCGSQSDLYKAAADGAGIKMLENRSGISNYLYPAERVEFINSICGIASQIYWRVGSVIGLTDFSEWYTNPFYWFVALKSSSGSKEVSRPFIGSGLSGIQTFSSTCDNDWFADYCWILSFSHGNNGEAIVGSKQDLINMITQGRKVRIMFDGYVMDADNIIINNGNIIAQLLSQSISQTETNQRVGAVISKLVRISTSGEMYTDLYQRGTSQKMGDTKSTTASSWFVDTRKRRLLLIKDSIGSAIEGSKSDLLDAVRAGSRLQCIVKLSPTEILSVTVDNIQVNTDGNIAAQFFRLMEFDDNDPRFIPFWRILILTTNGEMKETRWTHGEHEHRGDSVSYVDIEWFVD